MPDRSCEIDGCDGLVLYGELCEMHRKRRERGAPLHAPKQERLGAKERLRANAIAYADAEEDADELAAGVNLEKAAERRVLMKAGRKAVLARWHKTLPAERQRIAKELANKRWKKLSVEGKMRTRTHQGASDGEKRRQGAVQEGRASAGAAERIQARTEREPGRAAQVGEAAARPGALERAGDLGGDDLDRAQPRGEDQRPHRGRAGRARPGGPEACARGEGTGDA